MSKRSSSTVAAPPAKRLRLRTSERLANPAPARVENGLPTDLAPDSYRDHALGMLLGHALGDALGAPYEFATGRHLPPYDGTLKHAPAMTQRFHGKLTGFVGQTTDDTEMTSTLLQALNVTWDLGHSLYSRRIAAEAYMAWANGRSKWMGRNTRALFKNVKTVAGYERRKKKQAESSQSNGALMRCAPLALIEPTLDAFRALEADTRLTNDNIVCRTAAALYGRWLRAALRNETAELAPETVPEIDGALKDLVTARDVTGPTKGWAVHALWCARWALDNCDRGYAALVDRIVRLGGDTDTNAAIAGALVGARLGLTALLREPVTRANLELMMRAEPTSDTTLTQREQDHPRHLVELVDRLLAGRSELYASTAPASSVAG